MLPHRSVLSAPGTYRGLVANTLLLVGDARPCYLATELCSRGGEGQAIRGRVGGALSLSIRKRVFGGKIIGGGLLCQETITRAAFCPQLILEATRGLR